MCFLMRSRMKGEKLLIFLSLYALCLVDNEVKGSVISLAASPDVIKDGLTDSLKLHCSLNDTDSSSSEVSTIVLRRDGKNIASISRSNHAEIEDGSVNVKVSGSLAGGSGVQTFIEVEFQNPAKSDVGVFTCEINAARKVNTVSFSQSLEVRAATPTTSDLIKSIHDLKAKDQVMKQTIANLTRTIMEHPSNDIVFSAGISADKTVAFGRVVVYDKVFANVGSAYDPTTGQFTCPASGYYHFEMSAVTQGGSHAFNLRLFQNDKKDFSIFATHSFNAATNSGILKLSKGDVVKVVAERGTDSYSYLHSETGGILTTFNGQLVSLT